MPPKNRGETKAVNGKGQPTEMYYEEQRLSDAIVVSTLRLQALKRMYIDRMERVAMSKQQQLELSELLRTKEATLADKLAERVDVLTDYARQNKCEERDSIDALVTLEATLSRLSEEKRKISKEHEQQEAMYDKEIKEVKSAHEALCHRMRDMEKEFAAMLADLDRTPQAA